MKKLIGPEWRIIVTKWNTVANHKPKFNVQGKPSETSRTIPVT